MIMVTAVGINTEWGFLMASISEGSGDYYGCCCTNGLPLAVTLILDYSMKKIMANKALVSIMVVAVPKGLPLVVTLILAYSMKKVMEDKALLRSVSTCETIGSTTTICNDKTGTLTFNQVSVVEAHVGGVKLTSPDDGQKLSSSAYSLLFESFA
ncbi:calcium-transporting ATPase 5, plasma membrane-type-like [Dendrobium catenatum]|uniref:calcium-transporting ATPase 5, plasma membrane-type-like n=1 Tax=Dendrobium catenatum TaxID=906689 RepID=UPI0009F55317|nr:calcium-transporting ATPase 5, plasma membrane-type-like [Dendrobium catenatum]